VTAAEIAAALGNARREGGNYRCTCPLHGGRSLTLRDGRATLLVRCWAGCNTRGVLAELRRRGLFGGPAEYRPPPASVARADDNAARRIEIARSIWHEARDARGTPMERYFAGRRLTLPLPPPLRYAPFLWHRDGPAGPAMVARIDGPDGELIGVHRTWLNRGPDAVWRCRDRAMLGRAAGGAVRLSPTAETMLIGEGIETTLAGMQASGLPGWAAGSTSGMTALILPSIVRHVIICADHDRSGAGERAARTAAARWRAEARRVHIYMSPRSGEDAADLILAAAVEARDAA
jgi:putative DNA primase/helicase